MKALNHVPAVIFAAKPISALATKSPVDELATTVAEGFASGAGVVSAPFSVTLLYAPPRKPPASSVSQLLTLYAAFSPALAPTSVQFNEVFALYVCCGAAVATSNWARASEFREFPPNNVTDGVQTIAPIR